MIVLTTVLSINSLSICQSTALRRPRARAYTFGTRLTYGIHRRLFLAFAAVGLVPIFCLGILCLKLIEGTLVRETDYYLGKLSNQLVNHLDTFVGEMRNTLMTVALSDDLPVFLQGASYTAQQRYQAFSRINAMMLSAVSNRSYNDVLLIIRDRRYVLSTHARGSTGDLDVDAFDRSAFLAAMRGSQGTIRIVDPAGIPNPSGDRYAFALALDARAAIPGLKAETCFVIVTATRAFFDDLVRNVAEGVIDILVISDAHGRVVLSSADIPGLENVARPAGGRVRADGREYLVHTVSSRGTGWTVSFLASDDRIMASRNRLTGAVAGFLAVAALLILALSWVLAVRIRDPIARLKLLMRRVEEDDLSVRAPHGGNDELGDLQRSFNAMVTRLDRLVNELMRSRLLTREAELLALQQQVNPHFLYNALESINSLANQKRWEEIRAVAQQMAGIFRYCISGSPHESVRFADELSHVRDYLAIQQLRFGERISVSWDVDPRIPALPSVKLLLQPLVENALSHGLASRAEGAAVAIRGRIEGDDVVLEVEDNGQGIAPGVLAELRRSLANAADHPLETSGSIGLHNVQARIRLAFGPRYGVVLESREGRGTRVEVRLPRGQPVAERLKESLTV